MRHRYGIDGICLLLFLATGSVMYFPQLRQAADRASIVWGSIVRRGA